VRNHDLVIRNGMVVDGTGNPKYLADVSIDAGVITEVGSVSGKGNREIDAKGLVVTPGWVDAHTHFDGQVIWDSYLTPSCWHGVTTAVMGNCGVGFAPVKPSDQAQMINIMEGVEDIPGAVLREGVKWDWETFPEYLDVIASKPLVMDVAAQVPHAAVRVYVMGDRGSRNEPATADDIEKMSSIVSEALTAGAVGFSSSRTALHISADGRVVPGTYATTDEMFGFGRAIKAAGHGVFELATDAMGSIPKGKADEEFEWMTKLSRDAGAKLSFPLVQQHATPELWRSVMDRVEKARNEGAEFVAQTATRSIGMVMSWETTYHTFMGRPAYDKIASLPIAQRLARLRDPQIRADILSQASNKDPFVGIQVLYEGMFRLEGEGGELNYEPLVESSVQARADREGRTPDEIVYTMFMENEGKGYIYVPLLNYAHNNLDIIYELFGNSSTMVSLSDAGAHCGAICDASAPTFVLSFWARDRTRGPRLSIEQAVAMQSRRTAEVYGLTDRGIIAAGKKADINVIDFDRLRILPPTIAFDLPAGGRRLIQKAEGYRATIVSGVVTFENGEATGAMPGKLVRGGSEVGAAQRRIS
jgi:N-acyl-D-amino-acid deacylase